MTTTLEKTTLQAAPGQYLGFHLGDQEFGLDILAVQEINRQMAATRIPRLPAYVRGVINLRGRIVPVIDLRLRLGLPPREDDGKTCNIVVRVVTAEGEVVMGLVVDAVTEVHSVTAEQLSPPPEMGESATDRFITGIARLADGIVVLLDAAALVDLDAPAAGVLAAVPPAEAE